MRRTPLAVTIVIATMAIAACSGSEPPNDGPLRLEDLGTRWLDTPATVTYRTLERDAGEATSTHQCLRQYADRAATVDRQEAIRICSGEGTIRFVQDPPRWRMEVSSPDASFVLISTSDGTVGCALDEDGPPACTPLEDPEVPFEPLLVDPNQVLASSDLRTADVTRSEDRRIAGVDGECFSATSREVDGERLEWCYSSSGTLLSFTSITGLGAFASIEATEITPSVAATAFDLPAP